jgi:hypothetical protein
MDIIDIVGKLMKKLMFFWATLFVFVLAPLHASAEEPPPDPIDIYRQAAARVAAATAMSFHVEKRFDVVLIDGAKVEYSGALDVFANPAAGFFLDYGDDLSSRQAWYDGKKMTLLDTINNVYAMTPASGSNAEALIQVSEEHGLEMPLAPLLKRKLADNMEALGEASYLGIHDAEGEACHHLLFRGESKDLQVWISTGEQALLRKLVVTFWDIEGAPQQALTFSEWNLDAEIAADMFAAKIPEDSLLIEFLSLRGEK